MAENEGELEVEFECEPVADDDSLAARGSGEQAAPSEGAAEVAKLASDMAHKATEEAMIEIPVTAEKEDEKTDDQVTEIEEDKQNMGARTVSVDEVRDIPIDREDQQEDVSSGKETSVIEEVSVVESIPEEKQEPSMDQEPPSATKEESPVRKKVTVEESPPQSPVKKDNEDSASKKEPSWWKNSKKDEEEEPVEASIEEQKSEERSAPVKEPSPPPKEPTPPPPKEPTPPPAKEPTPPPPKEPTPVKEPTPEPEKEPTPPKEPSPDKDLPVEDRPKEVEYYDIPITAEEPAAVEQPEESSVELVPAESQPVESEPTRVEERRPAKEPSPPIERVSRRDQADAEREDRKTRAAAAAEAVAYAPTPVQRSPTYITYSSWAPATDYRQSYMPTYSSYVRPSRYYQSDYGRDYIRPTPSYVRQFDSYVRTGAFGQSSYATDRLRVRSRSRDRSGYSNTGYYMPPPLRSSSRHFSLPSRHTDSSGPPTSVPSRSGSFVNFMDYIVTTDRNLRRSTSRSSSIGIEDAAPISRSSSRTILPSSRDTINRYYDQQMWHVNNYVRRVNDVYDNNVYGYSSRYNTSKPYTGYITAGLGERSTYNRSYRGYSSNLERRLGTHSTYLRAYDLTRLPKVQLGSAMTRSIFW